MPATTEDPRAGLPSASGLALLVRCPGSWQASQGLPPLPQTRDAALGADSHDAWASLSPDELEHSKHQVCVAASEIRDRLYQELLPGDGPEEYATETRYWMLDDEGQPHFSAQVDWLCRKGQRGLIVDLKSLFGEHDEPDFNWQLLGQACCYYLHCQREGNPPEEIYAAIIQPRVSHHPAVVKYTAQDLEVAVNVIQKKLYEAVYRRQPPRYPGQHCAHCPAAGVCVEAQSLTALIHLQAAPAAVERLTPEQLSQLLPQLRVVEAVCNQVRLRAKQLALATPDAIPGYTIKEWQAPLEIPDAQACYEALKDYISKEAFRALLSVPVTELRQLFVSEYCKRNRATAAKAGVVFDEKVASVSRRGPPQPRLVKTKV